MEGWSTRNTPFAPWGEWQDTHMPPCTGACFTVVAAIRFSVSAWQLRHSAAVSALRSLSCFDAWGLWQFAQPFLSATGQCRRPFARVAFTMSL